MKKILLFLLFSMISNCSKKNMNDRDAKREQLRSATETKKQELSQTAGHYYGKLTKNTYIQDILLDLEVKNIPSKSGESVDPILVPVLSGSIKILFGNQDQGEYYSLSIDKADFDEKRKSLNLVASSESLKEIIFSLDQSELSLKGLWNSPSSATSGDVFLKKYDDLSLIKPEGLQIGGDYFGTLIWETKKLHQFAKMAIVTKQDKQATISIVASVKLFSGTDESAEMMVYDLDQVNFNPLTHKISLMGQSSEVYFIGEWSSGEIRGSWYSKLYGRLGDANWQKKALPPPDPSTSLMKPIRGVYYGNFANTSENSRLPAKCMLTLVSYHDKEKPGSLGVRGNIRFYYGSYSSHEYIEFPFDRLEYNYFTRKLDIITSGWSKFSLDLTIGNSILSGAISDEALGAIGSFEGTQNPPNEEISTMGGTYKGYFSWNQEKSYQNTSLELIPSFKNKEGVKILSSLSIWFGNQANNEKLFFNFKEADFSPTSGFVVLTTEDSSLTLKGYLHEHSFVGEWFIQNRGKVGNFTIKKDMPVELPVDFVLENSIKGVYQGILQNTSPQTDLPERFMIGLVTIPDKESAYGIKISSNIRFYMGPFDTNEFIEGSCENAKFDFFTKNLSMKCTIPKMEGFSIKGQISQNKIIGKLFYDSLGEVADFTVSHL